MPLWMLVLVSTERVAVEVVMFEWVSSLDGSAAAGSVHLSVRASRSSRRIALSAQRQCG